MIVFFAWIITFTVLTVRAVNAEAAAAQPAPDPLESLAASVAAH
jgi:hypothetical protein